MLLSFLLSGDTPRHRRR